MQRLAIALLTLGCAPAPIPDGPDGGCASIGTRGCPCPREGDILCIHFATTITCVDGAWLDSLDDPCAFGMATDAGRLDGSPDVPMDCSVPRYGCPCECEEERFCEGGDIRLQCLVGRWRGIPGGPCTDGPTCR